MDITTRILEEVAEREGCDPLDLPTPYDSIDADALERCIESVEPAATVRFSYRWYTITVRGDGEIAVEAERSGDPVPFDPPL